MWKCQVFKLKIGFKFKNQSARAITSIIATKSSLITTPTSLNQIQNYWPGAWHINHKQVQPFCLHKFHLVGLNFSEQIVLKNHFGYDGYRSRFFFVLCFTCVKAIVSEISLAKIPVFDETKLIGLNRSAPLKKLSWKFFLSTATC